MQRRHWMRRALALASAGALPTAGNAFGSNSVTAQDAKFPYAPVLPGTQLQFPRDHGAHPDHRIEWWYVTGWLDRKSAPSCGFQVTFFRVRTPISAGKSRFTATQLLFAHAAISDPQVGHILHEERAARAGFGLAEAALDQTAVWIRDWQLRQTASPRNGALADYVANVHSREFALQLRISPTQAFLLQGKEGFSQKGPAQENASCYYSMPQLAVSGEITVRGKREIVTGTAWLDHEWSSALLPQGAAGWDWLGLNLDDGSALMAFQMRGTGDLSSGKPLWSVAKLRQSDGAVLEPGQGKILFEPQRHWASPRGGRYPVETRILAGTKTIWLRPLFDAQELHSAVMGNTYWEGAVTAFDGANANAQRIGRGYWELTGYGGPLRL